MKLRVEGDAGSLARNPGAALDALADVAVADGADREEWLAKALSAAGGATKRVHVNGDPRFRIVKDLEPGVLRVHAAVMKKLMEDIGGVLDRAAEREAGRLKDLLR